MRTISLAICLALTGCSLFKAGEAEDAGFVSSPERLAKDERFPFHKWWVKAGSKKSHGGNLFLAPINIEYLRTTQPEQDKILAEQAIALGKRFHDRLAEELRTETRRTFNLVEDENNADGALEVAIVELVPTDVSRNAAGSGLGMVVPGGGLIAMGSSGSIAIEGRFRDLKAREVVAEFKDREKGQMAPIDLAGFSEYRYAERAIDDWAEQIVELLVTPDGAIISDSSPVTLRPW